MKDRFVTTRWSVVLAAGDHGQSRSGVALASLCETYWYPVYAYLRRSGYGVEDAQDLTQAFFTRLLEKNWLEAATPARGRFRSFLLASVKHFVANERDRAQAVKRGGANVHFALDTAEDLYRLEPRDDSTPETIYDRRWARTVFDRVFARLAQELTEAGKRPFYEALKSYLTGDESLQYSEMARKLGMSEGAVKVSVHRLRRRFGELLRAEVAESVAGPGEVDDELRHLKASLS